MLKKNWRQFFGSPGIINSILKYPSISLHLILKNMKKRKGFRLKLYRCECNFWNNRYRSSLNAEIRFVPWLAFPRPSNSSTHASEMLRLRECAQWQKNLVLSSHHLAFPDAAAGTRRRTNDGLRHTPQTPARSHLLATTTSSASAQTMTQNTVWPGVLLRKVWCRLKGTRHNTHPPHNFLLQAVEISALHFRPHTLELTTKAQTGRSIALLFP